jgi:hypothetical protein
MAAIKYDQTTPFGAKIYLAIQSMKLAQANLSRCIDVANNITGGGVTPANLEGSVQFGVAAGQGQNFYNALASLNSALYATPSSRAPVQATIDLDQG